MRVLYVEDDRVNALLFREACRIARGLEVDTAESGAEALALVESWRPEVLVIDLHLPDTDGHALVGALRARLGTRLPAFLCTADEPDLVADAAAKSGFDGVWSKPIVIPAILAQLEALKAR